MLLLGKGLGESIVDSKFFRIVYLLVVGMTKSLMDEFIIYTLSRYVSSVKLISVYQGSGSDCS